MADGYLGTRFSKAEIEMGQELQNIKEKGKALAKAHAEQLNQLKNVGIGTVSVAAIGYVSGKYPARAQVGGLPVIAIAGVLGLGAAASGYLDKSTGEAALAIGSAAAAAFAYTAALNKGAGKPMIASVTT